MSPLLAAVSPLAILAGALVGAGAFLLVIALRGLPPRAEREESPLLRWARGVGRVRAMIAVAAGVLALVMTHWLVAAIGVGLLALTWRGLSGSGSEKRAIVRLEALAVWTESLRDSVAGAAGLEQAIPASLRTASPVIAEPLARMADRLHLRVSMADALRGFADELDDSGADLVIAALVLNSRLRGPGLRDLLGSLSASVREELDMRRKVHAERRSTRRSVQIVVCVSVGMALILALLDRAFLAPYDGLAGQVVLAGVAGLYALGILWLRRLASFETPRRLLTTDSAGAGAADARAGAPVSAVGVRS